MPQLGFGPSCDALKGALRQHATASTLARAASSAEERADFECRRDSASDVVRYCEFRMMMVSNGLEVNCDAEQFEACSSRRVRQPPFSKP